MNVRGVTMRRLLLFLAAVTALLTIVESVRAHDPDEDILEVPEVSVIGETAGRGLFSTVHPRQGNLLQPQGRPAQVLRLIPGFVAVEHSGGAGKADQYFLRGFDADHGTDVAFFADGMPINFRTHAHGQGYTDLNFIIPETIEGLDVYKGAYLPEYRRLCHGGGGEFQDARGGSGRGGAGGRRAVRYATVSAHVLADQGQGPHACSRRRAYYTNGPFQNDNRYFRTNLLGKMTTNPTGRAELSLTGTFQKSQWNASGEIPLRAVQDGTLDRFGAIDPSEGGNTLRSTARLNYHYDTPSGGQFFANAYGQYYRLDLFTNFTFFLNDPVNGDGIQQSDRRVDVWRRSRIQAAGRCVWHAEHRHGRLSSPRGRYPCEAGHADDSECRPGPRPTVIFWKPPMRPL